MFHNQSDAPVTYVGVDDTQPTGWSAQAFKPGGNQKQPTPWGVANGPGKQAILTRAGTFWVWYVGSVTGAVVQFQQDGGDWQLSVDLQGNPIFELDMEVTVTPKGWIQKTNIAKAQPLAEAS